MAALAVIGIMVAFGLGLALGYTIALASLGGSAVLAKLLGDCQCANCAAGRQR